MKVASVSFSWGTDQIGGAQVPAVAFKEWCEIFGHSCDMLGFTEDFVQYAGLHLATQIKWYNYIDFAETLNKYDFIYFNTPGPVCMYKCLPDERQIDKLTKPYVVHLHGEEDENLYGRQQIDQLLMHSSCKALVTIDPYHKFWQFPYTIPQTFWYPCTLPDYLIKEETEYPNEYRRGGTAYAARLARCKNIFALAQLSKSEDFQRLAGPIHVYGTSNRKKTLEDLEAMQPDWSASWARFSIYDVASTIDRNSLYSFFWDVFGNTAFQIKMKRLNLAGWEAIRAGTIPLVNEKTVPNVLKECCITLDPEELKIEELIAKIDNCLVNYDAWQIRLKERVLESPYSYDRVKQQVYSILERA